MDQPVCAKWHGLPLSTERVAISAHSSSRGRSFEHRAPLTAMATRLAAATWVSREGSVWLRRRRILEKMPSARGREREEGALASFFMAQTTRKARRKVNWRGQQRLGWRRPFSRRWTGGVATIDRAASRPAGQPKHDAELEPVERG